MARLLFVAALILISIIYGITAAILPPQYLAYPAIPFLVAVGVILWMLPDTGGVNLNNLQSVMVPYVAVTIAWPYYVAFNLPGLPWISLTRIILFIVMSIFLFNFSTSKELRDQVKDSVSEVTPAIKAFWLFWAVGTLSLVFSDQISSSLTRYVNNQIYWTMALFVTALLATRSGFVLKISRTIAGATGIIIAYSLYEFYLKKVAWLDYIPAFFKIDPTILGILMESQARPGSDIYRVRGPYVASLYYAELLAVLFPFLLYMTVNERHPVKFIALASATLGCVVVMYLTDARSAMIGFIVASVFFLAVEAWRRRRLNSRSLGAMSVLMGYPAAVVMLSLIVWFWNRAHVAVLGGGQHQPSSDARDVQWAMTWPRVFTHPLGHGVGRGNSVLGYTNLGGEGSVDSYFITLLLDSGYLALPLFWLTFCIPVVLGIKYFVKSSSYEDGLLAPLSLGILNFVIIKAVSSAETVIPLVFVFMGCIFGKIWQIEKAATSARSSTAGLYPADRDVAERRSSFGQPVLRPRKFGLISERANK